MTITVKKKKKGTKKTTKEKILAKLSPRQELFCRLYTQNDFLFGNATLCYAEAYGYKLEELSKDAVFAPPDEKGIKEMIDDSPYNKAYFTCGVSSHWLLKNPKINDRIVDLLNEMMTDKQVDAEIMRTMKQNTDYGAKLSAVREYNKLKARIINKTDLTTNGKDIPVITGMEIIREPKKNEDTVQI